MPASSNAFADASTRLSISAATAAMISRLGEIGSLSQAIQAGRKALRIRHIKGMELRKKRPREFK